MSLISQFRALQIFSNTSVVTFLFLPNLAIDAELIPLFSQKSFFFQPRSINSFHSLL